VLPLIAPDKHPMTYIIPLFVNVNPMFRLTGMKITGRISKTSVFVSKYVIQDSEIMMILTWFGALPVITAGVGTHGTIHTIPGAGIHGTLQTVIGTTPITTRMAITGEIR